MKINKDKKYLVIFESNWADKMDINGFFTASGEYLLDIKKKLKAYKDELSICIGTNEEIEYSDGKELWDCLNIKEITVEQQSVLSELFTTSSGLVTDKEIFEDYIWSLVYEQVPNDDADYANKFKKLTKELTKEHKSSMDEIVKKERDENEHDIHTEYIFEAMNKDNKYEYIYESQNFDELRDAEIAKLSAEERLEMLEQGKKMNRTGEVSFGFSNVLDSAIEQIEQYGEDEE